MFITNNICANTSVTRFAGLNTTNIRLTAHFVPACRYSTSRACGSILLTTGPRSIHVVRDPIKVPNHTLGAPLIRTLTRNGHFPPGRYTQYLGAYSPTTIPCYVARTLVRTIGNGIRRKLFFYNRGINELSQVHAIHRLVSRLIAR